MKKFKKYAAITLIFSALTLTACQEEEESDYEKFKNDADEVGESIFNIFNGNDEDED